MDRTKISSIPYLIPEIQNCSLQAICEPFQDREVDLVQQWFSLPKGKRLQTQTGISFIIVNHGKRNVNKGPDIKGVILFIDEQWLKGDVECHIQERDWYTHGHDLDVNYTDVMLHVVRNVSAKNSPIRHTVVLSIDKQWRCSLDKENIAPSFIASLEALGTMRWQEKVEACRSRHALEQLAKPLGCRGNEDDFRRLIETLNIPMLNSLSFYEKINYIKRKAEYIVWEHCGIRPAQWPENRLILLAEIISFDTDLLLKNDVNQSGFFERLTTACSSGGRSILTECCVNYFYPLMAVRGLAKNDHRKYKQWYKSWQELKLPQPYGRLEKKYNPFLTRRELCTVGYVQGLLQLEKEYCTPKFCMCCPLKKMNYDFKN